MFPSETCNNRARLGLLLSDTPIRHRSIRPCEFSSSTQLNDPRRKRSGKKPNREEKQATVNPGQFKPGLMCPSGVALLGSHRDHEQTRDPSAETSETAETAGMEILLGLSWVRISWLGNSKQQFFSVRSHEKRSGRHGIVASRLLARDHIISVAVYAAPCLM